MDSWRYRFSIKCLLAPQKRHKASNLLVRLIIKLKLWCPPSNTTSDNHAVGYCTGQKPPGCHRPCGYRVNSILVFERTLRCVGESSVGCVLLWLVERIQLHLAKEANSPPVVLVRLVKNTLDPCSIECFPITHPLMLIRISNIRNRPHFEEPCWRPVPESQNPL